MARVPPGPSKKSSWQNTATAPARSAPSQRVSAGPAATKSVKPIASGVGAANKPVAKGLAVSKVKLGAQTRATPKPSAAKGVTPPWRARAASAGPSAGPGAAGASNGRAAYPARARSTPAPNDHGHNAAYPRRSSPVYNKPYGEEEDDEQQQQGEADWEEEGESDLEPEEIARPQSRPYHSAYDGAYGRDGDSKSKGRGKGVSEGKPSSGGRQAPWKQTPKKAEPKRVLPIQERRDEIVPLLCNEDASTVCCLVGETGSGKSTQVPQILLEEAASARKAIRICVTQPRRVAALNLAHRVAAELGENGPGQTVGYRIGGESSPGEYIDFCTTGYLLQLLLNAPEEFGRYTHLVLDEVHERSAESDMLCLVTRLMVGTMYPNTRLVVMSATLQSDLFSNYFASVASAPPTSVFVGARCFPVTEHFLDELPEHFDLQAASKAAIHHRIQDVFREQKPGAPKKPDQRHCDKFQSIIVDVLQCIAKPASTILVFLPGIAEISSLWEDARHLEDDGSFRIFPLHSMIPREEQEMVFQEPEEDITNVVLATDIAESSITLPHVVAVIDLGLHRRIDHDARTGVSALATKWISQAASTQRAGRAGRTQPGICVRMYTRDFKEKCMPEFEPPEAQSMPLDRLYLQAKQLSEKLSSVLGQDAPQTAEGLLKQMVQAPQISAIESARIINAEVGTISGANESARITSLGRLALQLPTDLRTSRLVWLGVLWGVPADAIVLGAVLSSSDAFSNPSPLFNRDEYDFVDKLRAATSSRLLFDSGQLSEPLMHRQLFLEWLEMFHKETWVYGNKEFIFRKRRKHTFEFSKHFSLSRGRMEHVVSQVQDLALRVYRVCDPESANAENIRELIRGLGYQLNYKMDLEGIAYKNWAPFSTGDIFDSSMNLIKGLLATAFSDTLFVGSYGSMQGGAIDLKANKPKETKDANRLKKEEALIKAIHENDFSLGQTVVFPGSAELLERYLEFVCGQRPEHAFLKVDADGDKVVLAELNKFEGNRWQDLLSRGPAPELDAQNRLPPEFNLLSQFEKSMRDAQKGNRTLDRWTYGLIPVHHPCLLNWEWMKELPVGKSSLQRCQAIFDRKNPSAAIGHMMNDNLRGGKTLKPVAIFAVAAAITMMESKTRAYPSGVTTLGASHLPFILISANLHPTTSGLKTFGFSLDGSFTILHRSFELPVGCVDRERWELISAIRDSIREELMRQEEFVQDGGSWRGHGAVLFDSPVQDQVRELLDSLSFGESAEPAFESKHALPPNEMPLRTVDLAGSMPGPFAFQALASWYELQRRRGEIEHALERVTRQQVKDLIKGSDGRDDRRHRDRDRDRDRRSPQRARSGRRRSRSRSRRRRSTGRGDRGDRTRGSRSRDRGRREGTSRR